jgi:hypothetical protein
MARPLIATALATLLLAGGGSLAQAKDPWKHGYKAQEKQAKAFDKHQRKQAKAWEKFERKRAKKFYR